VLPTFGGKVMIVNGGYRNAEGTLMSIDEEKFKGQVKLNNGMYSGRTVSLPYEDFSKLYQQ